MSARLFQDRFCFVLQVDQILLNTYAEYFLNHIAMYDLFYLY